MSKFCVLQFFFRKFEKQPFHDNGRPYHEIINIKKGQDETQLFYPMVTLIMYLMVKHNKQLQGFAEEKGLFHSLLSESFLQVVGT